MKYLTIFLISIFALFCIIECSNSEFDSISDMTNSKKVGKKVGKKVAKKVGKSTKSVSSKAKKAGKKAGIKAGKKAAKKAANKYKIITTCKNGCQKKQIPFMPKPLKLSSGDKAVCGLGKNLGLLDIGDTCSSTFPQCKKMIHRQPNIPVKSKIQKIKAAKKTLIKSKKILKKKKKWTLKGRWAKYHQKEIKARKAKELAALKKKMALKKWALKAIRNKIPTGPTTKKSLKKSANKVMKSMLKGKTAALRKSLGLKTKKQIRKQKIAKIKKTIKPPPENDHYCVQALEMNLSYCCLFVKRSQAIKVANTQPIRPVFTRQLRKGWVAITRDGQRKAKQTIKKVAATLARMNKLKAAALRLKKLKHIKAKAAKKAANKGKAATKVKAASKGKAAKKGKAVKKAVKKGKGKK